MVAWRVSMSLTHENYKTGFLVDEELMAGVTQHPQENSLFVAFVLRHTTGEYLGYQPFETLEEALQTINRVDRSWIFETVGCGGECAKGGGCSKGNCKKKSCGVGPTPC